MPIRKCATAFASPLLCLFLISATAHADVFGFDTLTGEVASYVEGDFQITTTSMLRGSGTRGNPAPSIHAASSSQTNTLARLDDAPFDLVTIQLAGGPSAGGTWPQMVTFTGIPAGGGSVSQSFTVTGSAEPSGALSNWQTFTFDPDFRGITSVSWEPQFTLTDNIVTLDGAPPAFGFDTLTTEVSSYDEDGFQLTTTSMVRPSATRGNPPPSIHAASPSQTNTLSHAEPFDLVTIQLAGGPSAGGIWPQTVTFTGTLAAGGSVFQSFTVTGSGEPSGELSNWQTFTFSPEFRGLSSVSWGPQFTLTDNIVTMRGSTEVVVVEPDASSAQMDISNLVDGVTLSAEGGTSSDNFTYAHAQSSPTGSLSFGWFDGQFYDGHWARTTSPALRAETTGFLAQVASIDFETDLGTLTLEAFGEAGDYLGSVTAAPGTSTLTFDANQNLIKSVEFSITPDGGADFGTLDQMVFRVPEPSGLASAVAAVASLALLGLRRRGLRSCASTRSVLRTWPQQHRDA